MNFEFVRDELFHDDNYLTWLKKFTEEFKSFSDDSWLYCPEEISEDDLSKVNNLSMLFEVVDDYADKNYIKGTKKDFGYSYDIKYQDAFFEVECMAGQGVCFNINRLENSDNYIDYEDLKEGKLTERALKINAILEKTRQELNEVMTEEDTNKIVKGKILKKI